MDITLFILLTLNFFIIDNITFFFLSIKGCDELTVWNVITFLTIILTIFVFIMTFDILLSLTPYIAMLLLIGEVRSFQS